MSLHQVRLSARGAFSLIELLVVVAIIAVLASILMPALGIVRAKARTVVCAGQLRQVGLGCFAYAADAHGMFPPAFANPNTFLWIKTFGGEANGLGALVPDYLDDARVTVCPNFNLSNGTGTYASIAAFAKRYAGYRYNGNPYDDSPSTSLNHFVNQSARNYIGRGWPLGVGRFKGSNTSSEGTVLAYDAIAENTDPKGAYHPHPGDRIPRSWGYLPLVQGGNVLFSDGHVVFLPGANWRSENGTMTSGSYYCPLSGY